MERLQIDVEHVEAEERRAETRRRRVIFWIIAGAVILLALWFVVLPAVLYDSDRPTRPEQTRGAPRN